MEAALLAVIWTAVCAVLLGAAWATPGRRMLRAVGHLFEWLIQVGRILRALF